MNHQKPEIRGTL